jgi:hypothetical protein
MTYTQKDYNEVRELLAPTPERVATAKAWLAERLRSNPDANVGGALATEFVAAQGIEPEQPDSRDPAGQSYLIPFWQWAGALRYAIHDFHRAGLITPTDEWDPKQTRPEFLDVQCPLIALGEAGDNERGTPFPAVVLHRNYAISVMGAAEREHRLELYDADLYMARARIDRFDDRARRCIEEALACYRSDLFLAAANMLGAASEAVWHALAEQIVAQGLGGKKLIDELAKPFPSIAAVQTNATDDLKGLSAPDFLARFSMPRSTLDSLAEVARYWRDVRNFGMHPAGALGPEAYSQSSVGVQMMGATEYFDRLAQIMDGL